MSLPPKRVHPSGRVSSRRKVHAARAAALPLVVAGEAAAPWREVAPPDEREIELEIGCGKGTFLVAAAALRPGVWFVGIEASPAYASYCADRLARRQLGNARMVADDARLFLRDTVPRGRVARVHVYHPDPWPKRRHRKRRLFGPDFPDLVADCLRPGGELLVATDNSRYFGEILAVLGPSERFVRARRIEARYGDEIHGLAFGPTNFARKYVEEGRPRHRAVWVTSSGAPPRQIWVRAARVADIPEEGGLTVACGGKELALFRLPERIACVEDSCPHRGAALSAGRVRNGEVVCPWHGWRYRLDDGECSTLPGSMPAATFEVRVEGDEVFVRVEEGAADLSR